MEAIALLTERSKKETLDATQALSGQLLELQDATKTAAAEIEDMTTSVSGRIEAVLERAGEAVNASRKGLDAQAEALGLLIDHSRAALTAIGSETADNLSTNAALLEARLRDIYGLLQKQIGLAGHSTARTTHGPADWKTLL